MVDYKIAFVRLAVAAEVKPNRFTSAAMASQCSHWIWQTGGSRPTIAVSDRLRVVTSSLAQDAQCPSLVLLIGCRRRFERFTRPKRQSGRLCLDLDNEADEQLLVGTNTLYKQHGNRPLCCRADKEHRLPSQMDLDTNCSTFDRLLYPFVDVYCYYSYNMRDLTKIARTISSQMRAVRSDVRFYRPWLVVVLGGSHWRQERVETVAAQHFERVLPEPLESHFSGIQFIKMLEDDSYANIRPVLAEKSGQVRRAHAQARALFSVEHFVCLIDRAFDMVSSPSFESFDYVAAARQDFPVSTELHTHMNNFVHLVPPTSDLRTFATDVIASSILLDQYPPGMHRKLYPILLCLG